MPRRPQSAVPANAPRRNPARSAPRRFRPPLLGAVCLITALAACGASPSPTTAETAPAPSPVSAIGDNDDSPASTPVTRRTSPETSGATNDDGSTTETISSPPETAAPAPAATTSPNAAAATTGIAPTPPETATASTTGPATTTNPPPATSDAPAPPAATTTAAPPPPATSDAPAPATTAAPAAERGPPRRYLPQLVERLPHDRSSFTQGLVWRQGVFYESLGNYGKSAVRITDPATGAVIREQTLPDQFFGEGLEVVEGRVVQLTWWEETAFIWEAGTLEPLGTFAYQGEGWGLCAQEDRFVMSDGSSVLTFRHLETFQPLGTVEVTREGEPVPNLNELECANGLVYANIWQTDYIAVIDPADGTVTGLIDGSGLTGLLDDREGINVLNGIAYRPDRGLFYLTGKWWPNLFLVELVPHP